MNRAGGRGDLSYWRGIQGVNGGSFRPVMNLAEVATCQSAPVFLVWIGVGFALDHGDDVVHLAESIGTPRLNHGRIRPALPEQALLGEAQAVASDGGLFQLWVDVAGVIMLAMPAKP